MPSSTALSTLIPGPWLDTAFMSFSLLPVNLLSLRCDSELPDAHGLGVYNGTRPLKAATALGPPKYSPPLPPVRFGL